MVLWLCKSYITGVLEVWDQVFIGYLKNFPIKLFHDNLFRLLLCNELIDANGNRFLESCFKAIGTGHI